MSAKPKHKPGIHLFQTRERVGSIKSDKQSKDAYEDRWYWHIVSRNGRIIARSSETYTRKGNAVKSIKVAANLFYTQLTSTGKPAYYDHSKPDLPLQSYL